MEKGTNGTSIKNRLVLERDQERISDDDNDRDVARIGDRRSPDSERRLSKSLRSPSNEGRNSTHDRSHHLFGSFLKSSGKQLPSQDSTDTSGDELEGSRARENARKANSARRKTKEADRQLNKVRAESTTLQHSVHSQQLYDIYIFLLLSSGKDVQKKHRDQQSESSEDDLASRRMKRRTDSPDGRSPPRIEKDDSLSKEVLNSEHAMRGLREDSDDGTDTKKHLLKKVNLESHSEDGSPVRKPKKRTGISHIESGSSGSDEPDKHGSHSEKKRHKKAHRHKKQYDDSSESDSESDGKEAKRRRKEEKRLRKEEKRRRREERHRKRAERHACKQKSKHTDTVGPPSDSEKDRDSDSDFDRRKRGSPAGKEESDQKKLEIELREKALESLRAKKAIN
nr:unnamed protein product [Digitaria exilis]